MYLDERTILYLYSSHKEWVPGELVVKPWESGLLFNKQIERAVRLTTRHIRMAIAASNP